MPSTPHEYDDAFYDYIGRVLRSSASIVIDLLRREFAIGSVADFGCGRGTWLAAWQAAGTDDVCGVDGDYVRRESLLVDRDLFVSHDLAKPLRLGRSFDLVESLEVAEHLPEASAADFVDTLCAHGSLILFAAAVPGQGGEHHVNEQPYDYWRRLFAQRGFVALDLVRPAIRGNARVAAWYRYNLLVYVHKERLTTLGARLDAFRVADAEPIREVSPVVYRLRKALLRRLPSPVLTWIAQVHKHLALRWRA